MFEKRCLDSLNEGKVLIQLKGIKSWRYRLSPGVFPVLNCLEQGIHYVYTQFVLVTDTLGIMPMTV